MRIVELMVGFPGWRIKEEEESRMIEELKVAATTGLLLGVKYAIAIAVVIGVGYLLFADYQKVRGSAALGEQAYRYLVQGIQSKHLPEDWAKIPAPQPVAPLPVPEATPKK